MTPDSTPSPSAGTGDALREAIARIVDPNAWANRRSSAGAAGRRAKYQNAALAKAEAILAALPQDRGGEWQPIETAPKDGKWVDLWMVSPDGGHGSRIADCRWDSNRSFNGGFARVAKPDAWVHCHGGRVHLDGGRISHWRPLPGGPQAASPSRVGVPDDVDVRAKALEEAARAVLDRMFSTYKARNGREVGIQGDDGEKCWIVHSDEIAALEAALAHTNPMQGRE